MLSQEISREKSEQGEKTNLEKKYQCHGKMKKKEKDESKNKKLRFLEKF